MTSIFVVCCIGCLSALPAAAFADPAPAPRTTGELFTSAPAEDAETETADATLPTQLDSWGDDPREYADFSILTITELPQGRMSTKQPFIDFDRTQVGGFVGAVKFSSDFKAKTNVVAGVNARVPVPGLPGNWGAWADLYVAGIDRNLAFFYPNQSGTWFGGTIGADYTFYSADIFALRGQAGVSYTYWNGVQSLDNGMGGTLGIDLSWEWIKNYHKATVNLTPQITFSGSNYYAFLSLGFQVEF